MLGAQGLQCLEDCRHLSFLNTFAPEGQSLFVAPLNLLLDYFYFYFYAGMTAVDTFLALFRPLF